MKEESHNDGGGGGGNSGARVCDTIRAAACAAYCKADMAYLGADCDARVHAANRGASRHERVFVCEACKKAPAAFLCKVDAASLCTACDAAIHSANPLARRHLRVPIPAIWGSRSGFLANGTSEEDPFFDAEGDEGEDEEEVASWLLLNNPATARNGANNINDNNGFLFGGEVEEYLDLVEYNDKSQYVDQHSTDNKEQQQQQYGFALKGYGGDAVVPHVQCEVKDQQQHQINFQLGLNFESSKAANNLNGSICQSVSISSTDTGVVPDSTSEISISHSRSPKGTIDHFSGHPIQMPPQLTPIDREARVLRYREKKKTRKFQKTIRYASRKAYAETRPRIKGRFAKRKNVEVKMDQMFSTTLVTETGYGIVPSF